MPNIIFWSAVAGEGISPILAVVAWWSSVSRLGLRIMCDRQISPLYIQCRGAPISLGIWLDVVCPLRNM